MGLRLLQGNLNRSRAAQDIFLHTLAESGYAIGVAAEPNRIPENHPCWVGDATGSVAITWRWRSGWPPCSVVERGRYFAAVKWGGVAVVGVYLPPNRALDRFERWLDGLGACVRRLQPGPVLVAGDFNSWSTSWGSRATNARGEALEEWAATLGLSLLNRGGTSTCVRRRGESIVDLTWASPAAAARVSRWEVMTEVEHLSDHRYISVELTSHRGRRPGVDPRPRWALRKVDVDALRASVVSAAWSKDAEGVGEDPVREAEWLRGTLSRASDAAMPRAKPRLHRAAYWWTDEIAEYRRLAVHFGRRVARAKRMGDSAETAEAWEAYREARHTLRSAIGASKARAWEELLLTLDEDPWGRPYKIVLQKCRPWAPPLTESLDPEFVRRVVGTLFPACSGGEGTLPPPRSRDDCAAAWTDELGVGEEELVNAAKRGLGGRFTAPGPDGIHKRVHALAWCVLGDFYRQLFNSCLKRGVFPSPWRRASLVLLRKEGKEEDSPSAYRPICLLDEAGKLFERVIANRLVHHLSRVGPDISGAQYGFRGGRSTLDAIRRVRALSEERVAQGGVMLAISLDIANAFNTLPWATIMGSLRRHEVPEYLVDVLRDYFRDRWVQYLDRDRNVREGELRRGVPQGSVLGPLLWNVGYDAVLQTALPPGCHVICYADDTLVLAGGRDWGESLARGGVAVAAVVRAIRGAGLEVAAKKTEAIFFHPKGMSPPPEAGLVVVDGAQVRIGTQMRYLGLILDGTWCFRGHLAQAARRARERSSALARILPNLGGPDGRVRRLYANTVRSVALYGAPVWASELAADRRARAAMAAAFRPIAARVARAYRTVSHAAATVMAGMPPMELVALEYARAYDELRTCRAQGVDVTPAMRAQWRHRYRRSTLERWAADLAAPGTSGQRTVGAILPVLEEWVGRARGGLSFHSAQVVSGHGCFGAYLCRIGKERAPGCHHCDEENDTAQHTLEACPAWAEQRATLVAQIGPDLSMASVIEAILRSEEGWKAFSSFCIEVMRRKEEAERERRGEGQHGQTPPRRAGRGRPRGGRGGGGSRRLPPPPRPPPPPRRRGDMGSGTPRSPAAPVSPVRRALRPRSARVADRSE